MGINHDAKFLCDQWRATVGRLPLAHAQTIHRLTEQQPMSRMREAIEAVAGRGFRRTEDRWRLFLAWFGEAP